MIEDRIITTIRYNKNLVIWFIVATSILIFCFSTETKLDRECVKEKYSYLSKGYSDHYADQIERACLVMRKREQ